MLQWLLGNSVSWHYVERISVLISYITIASICIGTWQIWRFIRRHTKSRQFMKGVDGSSQRPIALAVSIRGSIRTDVEGFLAGKYTNKITVKEYSIDEDISSQNIQHHLQKLKDLKHELQADGVTELHFFFKGPLMLGVLLGAMLDNWIKVKLYQKNTKTGQYEEWSMLHCAKELIVDEQLPVQVAEVIDKING